MSNQAKLIVSYIITVLALYLLIIVVSGCASQKQKCQKSYNYLLDNCPQLAEVKHDTITIYKSIPGVNITTTSLVQVPCDEIIKNQAKGDTVNKGKKTLIKGSQKGVNYKTDVDLGTGKVSTEIQTDPKVITVTGVADCVCITSNEDVWEWAQAKFYKYKWWLITLVALIALIIGSRSFKK